MSRPINAIKIDLCDIPEIAVCQAKDEEVKKFPHLKNYKYSDNLTIKCDTSTPYPRHFMPVVLIESIFRSLRLVGHPGIKGTYKLVKTRYFWSDMDGNIRNGVEFVFPVNRVKLKITLVVQFQVLTFRQTVSKRYTLILLVRYHQ